MLKKLVNEAFCTLRITASGPLLIKTGHASISGPDMSPVLTFRNGKQEAFLPGSSLKGVFRSHVEKLVCSLQSQVVCYPFDENEERQTDPQQRRQDYRKSCGVSFTQRSKEDRQRRLMEARSDLVYADSCPTCRLFGSTGFIGRVAIGDAYLASEENKEFRDGVGIDRLTGGASHSAKFELEVVSAGTIFETNIHLRNFEIWQLGMLFVVIQDMEDGLIAIGSGRSRGLGKVTAEISASGVNDQPGGLVLNTIRNSQEPPDELRGLGRWLNDGSYGTRPDDYLTLDPPVEHKAHGIREQRAFTGEALDALRAAAIENFIGRIQEWPRPTALDRALQVAR
jgi:CRISPR-associated RAMP protein (TIGR02581 family)